MIEMRWFVNAEFVKVLQYRYQITTAQGLSILTEWIDVPTVTEE
jgi:hypothetical protein